MSRRKDKQEAAAAVLAAEDAQFAEALALSAEQHKKTQEERAKALTTTGAWDKEMATMMLWNLRLLLLDVFAVGNCAPHSLWRNRAFLGLLDDDDDDFSTDPGWKKLRTALVGYATSARETMPNLLLCEVFGWPAWVLSDEAFSAWSAEVLSVDGGALGKDKWMDFDTVCVLAWSHGYKGVILYHANEAKTEAAATVLRFPSVQEGTSDSRTTYENGVTRQPHHSTPNAVHRRPLPSTPPTQPTLR